MDSVEFFLKVGPIQLSMIRLGRLNIRRMLHIITSQPKPTITSDNPTPDPTSTNKKLELEGWTTVDDCSLLE